MNKANQDALLELAEILAAELHAQADGRRQRAIVADQQKGGLVPNDVVDRWASSFATSYQTLMGIATALENAVARARAQQVKQ